MDKRWKQRLIIFLTMALALGLLAGCDTDDGQVDTGEGADTVSEETIREQVGEPGDTDLGVEPDEGADITLDEREVLEDDQVLNSDSALQGEAQEVTSVTFLTAGDFLQLNFVNESGEETGKVIEALFDVEGHLRFVILDSEAIVAVDDEPVGAWAVEWEALDVQAAEVDALEVDSPFVLRSGDADPSPAPVADTGPLAVEDLFVDTDALGLERAQGSLIRVRAFVGLDSVDVELVSAAGDTLGSVDDLLIAVSEGRVQYVVADAAGVDNVVIPWMVVDIGEGNIVYTGDEQLLSEAPTVGADGVDRAMADEALAEEVDSFWRERGALSE